MERRPEGEGEGARKGQAGSRGWGGGCKQQVGVDTVRVSKQARRFAAYYLMHGVNGLKHGPFCSPQVNMLCLRLSNITYFSLQKQLP